MANIEIPDLEDVKFEEECDICYGTGRRAVIGKEAEVCWRCEGRKEYLTPVGERLIDFLKKHYGLQPRSTDV